MLLPLTYPPNWSGCEFRAQRVRVQNGLSAGRFWCGFAKGVVLGIAKLPKGPVRGDIVKIGPRCPLGTWSEWDLAALAAAVDLAVAAAAGPRAPRRRRIMVPPPPPPPDLAVAAANPNTVHGPNSDNVPCGCSLTVALPGSARWPSRGLHHGVPGPVGGPPPPPWTSLSSPPPPAVCLTGSRLTPPKY